MPKRSKITCKKLEDRYVLNIPAGLSNTGKRQRLFFETKREAEMHQAGEEDRIKKYGQEGTRIKPALAEDATKAAEILKPYGATLTQAAKAFEEKRKQQDASLPFVRLWDDHMEALAGRSAPYLRSLNLMGRKLLPYLGKKLVFDIEHRELAHVLGMEYPTPYGFNAALRSLSPFFERAVREGYAEENPCRRIERRDTGRHEIRFLTVEQARNVIAACKDYRKDKKKPEYMRRDARDSIAAIVLMLFGGVRPKEATRLEWRDIDMEDGTVRVSNQKAKTDRSRFFEMPDTLKAWLETIPMEERQDKVVPPAWDRKWKTIRRHAGFADIPDALRKTFVTHHLAAYGDVNKTRAIIGHEVGDVLFSHYRGAVSKRQGLAFFEIKPANTEHEKIGG